MKLDMPFGHDNQMRCQVVEQVGLDIDQIHIDWKRGEVRVIFDASRGVLVNLGIRVRDQVKCPAAGDSARAEWPRPRLFFFGAFFPSPNRAVSGSFVFGGLASKPFLNHYDI